MEMYKGASWVIYIYIYNPHMGRTSNENPILFCLITSSQRCVFLFHKDYNEERILGFAVFLSVLIWMWVMAAMQCCTYLNHRLNPIIGMKNWISASLGHPVSLIYFNNRDACQNSPRCIFTFTYKTKPRPWTKNLTLNTKTAIHHGRRVKGRSVRFFIEAHLVKWLSGVSTQTL